MTARRALVICTWIVSILLGISTFSGVFAQTLLFEGYLCCNMRSDGKWISDINYHDSNMQLIPAGTTVKITGLGRWRVLIEIGDRSLAIGNDYSRTMSMEEFARRYVVTEDPRTRARAAPAKIREAIQAAKVTLGMTREQVLLAIGYPISSYNENLDAPLWRYWIDRSSEFQVFWGNDGHVNRIFGAPETRARVTVE